MPFAAFNAALLAVTSGGPTSVALILGIAAVLSPSVCA